MRAKLLCSRSLGVTLGGKRGTFPLHGRHIIQNSLAGVADDDLLVGADVVINLGAQHDLASGALMVASLR